MPETHRKQVPDAFLLKQTVVNFFHQAPDGEIVQIQITNQAIQMVSGSHLPYSQSETDHLPMNCQP